MAQSRIIDQWGQPIELKALREPQTAGIGTLAHEWISHGVSAGLSPARLTAILREADEGNLLRQHELFEDMMERDAHLAAEMGKRCMAIQTVEWDIVPPRNATAAEKKAAEWVEEVLRDQDGFQDLLLAMMDAIGHGFAPLELEWRVEGREWLPQWHARPQTWFQLDQARRELRLRDNSADGAVLQPFGWIMHTRKRAKTGYIGRLGLHRVLAWPYLYKAYGIGDFAEMLEIYGLPFIVGKYFPGSSSEEKSSLLRAVTALGHDARAIMPADMEIEIKELTGGGSGQPLHLRMVEWADKAQSKAILGGTLTSQADGKTSTNALGKIHEDVRDDILVSDTDQIAATLTRDLIYPLLALNLGGIDSLRRCPRLVFDVEQPEDIQLLSEALPKLVAINMKIPASWAHARLKVPAPEGDEPVLAVAAPAQPPAPQPGAKPGKPAALRGEVPEGDPFPDQTALDAALDAIPAGVLDADMQQLLAPVFEALEGAGGFEDALVKLGELYPQMNDRALEERLVRVMFAAQMWGEASA